MIKEALQWIKQQGFQHLIVDGHLFCDKRLIHIEPPPIDMVKFSEVPSFAAFCEFTADKRSVFILVGDEAAWLMAKELQLGYRRVKYAELSFQGFKHDDVYARLRGGLIKGIEVLG